MFFQEHGEFSFFKMSFPGLRPDSCSMQQSWWNTVSFRMHCWCLSLTLIKLTMTVRRCTATKTDDGVHDEGNSNNCPFVSLSVFAARASNAKNVNAATCKDLWPPQQKALSTWSHLHATSITAPHALLLSCVYVGRVEVFDWKSMRLPKWFYCLTETCFRHVSERRLRYQHNMVTLERFDVCF